MLLFYVATGWYQTLNPNRNKAVGEARDWVSRLREVHVDQVFPTALASSYSTGLYKGMVVLMALALILTTLLGIIMALRVNRRKWPVWLALSLGLFTPVLLLWLGQHR